MRCSTGHERMRLRPAPARKDREREGGTPVRGLRERAAQRLLRMSVEHALDSLEIQQRHRSLRYHGSNHDLCGQMVLVAESISRASLWLARLLYPAPTSGETCCR
jgi:hypothetical protein